MANRYPYSYKSNESCERWIFSIMEVWGSNLAMKSTDLAAYSMSKKTMHMIVTTPPKEVVWRDLPLKVKVTLPPKMSRD